MQTLKHKAYTRTDKNAQACVHMYILRAYKISTSCDLNDSFGIVEVMLERHKKLFLKKDVLMMGKRLNCGYK